MIKKEDVKFLIYLTSSLKEAELKLEKAYEKGNGDEFNQIKKFILKIQSKIDEVLR